MSIPLIIKIAVPLVGVLAFAANNTPKELPLPEKAKEDNKEEPPSETIKWLMDNGNWLRSQVNTKEEALAMLALVFGPEYLAGLEGVQLFLNSLFPEEKKDGK